MREKVEIEQDNTLELVGIPKPATHGYFGSVEEIEEVFGIEYSCGDGLFRSDIEPDKLSDEHDGNVDWTMIRNAETKRVFRSGALLCFTYNPDYRRNGGELFEKARVKGRLVAKP